MQVDKSFEVRGTWSRSTHYEQVNCTIVPATDAVLKEYDPWDVYRANVGKYRTVQQPYGPLLELGRHLEAKQKRGIRPSEFDPQKVSDGVVRGPQNEADSLILDWCNEHGLLGLVPVLSTSIHVDDRIRHFRDGGKWFTSRAKIRIRNSVHITEWSMVETGKEDSLTPSVCGYGAESITWLNWFLGTYDHKGLADKRAYFGSWSEGEAFTPHRPGTQSFWIKYGEPVREFCDWCIVFTHAVSVLSGSRRGLPDETKFFDAGLRVLNRLSESALPHFEAFPTKPFVLDEERTPAGLLASYALMFLWDLVEGRRALRCKNCDRYFISDEHQAAYCSERCRNTAQSRRYRAKKGTRR